MWRSSGLFFAAVTCALWGSSRDAATQSGGPAYGVTDLGTIGGGSSVALAVDDGAFPFAYGYSATVSGDDHAFAGSVWGPLHDLGTLGGRRSEARASSNGRVVGRAQLPSATYHAFLQDSYGGPSGLRDLGTLGGSESNANGIAFAATSQNSWKFLIVGNSTTPGDAATRAFIYDTSTSTMSDLGATLGGPSTTATAINSALHVVGYGDLPGGQSHHAFLYANGATQDLGSLGTTSDALALNDTDTIVGRSQLGNGAGQHAFRYQGGTMQDLGTLGGASSEAADVNPGGAIVGWAETAQGARHAFIWRGGVMTDLNTLIPSGTGWLLQAATGIGNGAAGREAIVGYGQFKGQTRAFFLTPPLDLRIDLHVHRNQLDTNFPNPHEAGQPMTMGATVWNDAGFTATGVTVTDTLGGPVQIDSWYGADSCAQNGLQLTCTFGRIDGTGNGRDLMVNVHATGAGAITHSAAITSADQPDPNAANNSASESNTAVSLASLVLNSSSVVGGQSVLSRATLTSRTPGGGATVKLTSSRPDIASVPSQFDVLPWCCDGIWREFYVTTKAVSAPVTVDISATYGLVTKIVPLTITPPPTGSPYGGSAWPIPGTIQAEDFNDGGEGVAYHDTDAGNNGGAYRATDVDIQATADAGGGFNVGWIGAGEWLTYTVNVAAAGTYTLDARVASPGAGGTFHVDIDGANKTGTISVPDTGGWQAWTTVSQPITLAAGVHTLRVTFDTNGASGAFGNLNYLRFTAQAAGGPTPFGGTARSVPGTIEAEDFDDGGEGVAYHDSDATNNGGQYRATAVDIQATTDAGGGYNVGWMTAGEWLNYTVSVGQSGTYTLTTRVAANGAGGTFHVEFGGVNKTGTLTIPNTGGWQAWTDVSATVTLSAGVQSMRIVEDANGPTGVFGNINYVRLASAGAPPPPPSGPANVVVYSSDLTLHGAWTRANDAAAAGGQKALTPDVGWSTTSAPLANPADYFEASFDAPSATGYAIWLRIRATGDTKYSDSVWVQFSDALANGAAVYPIGSTTGLLVNLEPCNSCGVSGWGWQNGAYWLTQATTVSFAASGRHTIRVQVREDGAQVDQIVLSPAQYLQAAPGPVKGDSTIVPK